jgi:Bestrophin, RFP-TM, chloride channel
MVLLDVLQRVVRGSDSHADPAASSGGTWLDVTDKGHAFISLLVGFLLVNRVSNALNRYWKARDGIGIMYRECREIVQLACVITSTYSATSSGNEMEGLDLDRRSQMVRRGQWFRHILAYRAIAVVQTSMAMASYPTEQVPSWDIPELNGPELYDIRQMVFRNHVDTPDPEVGQTRPFNEWKETMRVPIRLAYLLKRTIHAGSQPDNEVQHDSLIAAWSSTFHETSLLNHVSQMMEGYFAIQKFMTTPVPAPMVYMSRTFMFLYVFTVPFVFLRDSSSTVLSRCVAIFILTYGFVGLELVAQQLDNPFGNDAIDLPHM